MNRTPDPSRYGPEDDARAARGLAKDLGIPFEQAEAEIHRIRRELAADTVPTVHVAGEIGAILNSMPLTSIGPSGIGGDFQSERPAVERIDAKPNTAFRAKCLRRTVKDCPGFYEPIEAGDNGMMGHEFRSWPAGQVCDCCGHFLPSDKAENDPDFTHDSRID